MKRLNHTLLSNKCHLYFFTLLLFSLGLFCFNGFILFFPFLAVAVKQIKKLVILIILLVFLLLVVNTHQAVDRIDGNVVIVNKEVNTYQTTYTIKYRFKQYQFNSRSDYEIGSVVKIAASTTKFRKQTNPFGYNGYYQQLSNNIVGKLEISSISVVGKSFSISTLKGFLLSLNIPLIDFLLGDKEIINDTGLDYLFKASAVSILGFIYIIKKALFYLNISNEKQDLITFLVLLALLVLSDKLAVLIIFLRFIINKMNTRYKLYLTKLDIISLSGIIILFIKPYLIYSQSFWIIFLIIIFYQLSHLKHPLIKIYLPTLILLPFWISWDYSFSLSAFLAAPLLYKYFKRGFIFVVAAATIFPYLPILKIGQFVSDVSLILINTFPLQIRLGAFNQIQWVIYFALLVFITSTSNGFKQMLRLLILFGTMLVAQGYKQFYYEDYIYFLDVNQGDGAVISHNNKIICVDAFDNVYEFLLSQGKYQIDYLILTHSDLDHTRQAKLLLEKLTVKNLILSAYDDYSLYHPSTIYISAHNLVVLDDVNIRFLGPINEYNNPNDNSLVFSITIKGVTTLFTGDISRSVELDLIARYNNLGCDILKVAHHGANSSTHPNFISKISPQYAFISCGENNSYNHPHLETLNILKNNNVTFHCSADHGAIKVVFKNKRFKVINRHNPH